ncbi:unnamed protein product [Rhizopus stolonifer]
MNYKSFFGGVMMKTSESPDEAVLVRAVLLLVADDTPVTRKAYGFTSHNSKNACMKCKKRHTIGDSAVHRHITEKLKFILTRTQTRVTERNSKSTIELRRQSVEHIDETGFKKNMMRLVAWSHKETSAEAEVLCTDSVNLRILGRISTCG